MEDATQLQLKANEHTTLNIYINNHNYFIWINTAMLMRALIFKPEVITSRK